MNRLLSAISAIALLLLFSFPANATIVDFDAFAPQDTVLNVISYQGLDFTRFGSNGFMLDWDNTSTNPSPNSNGTPALIFLGFGGPSEDFVRITKTGGGIFDLNSLDMTISWYDTNASEQIFINGNPITLFQGIQTYNLNLTGVTQVDVTGFPDGYWLMDNVVYDATAVPEPGTLTLMGMGMAGVALIRRRKRAHTATEAR